AFRFNEDTQRGIRNPSGQLHLASQPVNKRPEPHALNGASNDKANPRLLHRQFRPFLPNPFRNSSRHCAMPAPVLADTSHTCIPGRTVSMFRYAALKSNPTTDARSVLVMIAMSAVLKMVGYLSGLSSPSVTERRTARKSSPRS